MERLFADLPKSTGTKIKGRTLSCPSCGLSKGCKSPKMKPFGNFKKGILNIGEAPGKIEDARGKPFQGRTGQLLQQVYTRLGIDLFEDCLNINAVNCRPPNNRTPNEYEIGSCRKFVWDVIKKHKPKLIVVLGGTALNCILSHRWKKQLGGITKWRGWVIPDRETGCWICPTFHPSYVSRDEKNHATEVVWREDLKQAFSYLSTPIPKYKTRIRYLKDDLSELRQYKGGMIAFDYETTGIKPHSKGHRVVCASVAVSEELVYAFMIPKKRSAQRPFLELLEDKETFKIAHNMKFEDHWTNVVLRSKVSGWGFDTMLASHILDNRTGVCGLKFQAYVNFGVLDYDSTVSPFLNAVEAKNGNSMNSIYDLVEDREGERQLLKYCALDSLYEYRLAVKQMRILKYDTLPF